MEIKFKKGIPGFENSKEFVLSEVEENKMFKLLESKEDKISFVTVVPFEIYSEYEIELNDETIKELEIEDPNDVLVLSIVTLGDKLESSTINLKAPIVINIQNKLGKQFIQQSEIYETKHPLIRSEQNVSSY